MDEDKWEYCQEVEQPASSAKSESTLYRKKVIDGFVDSGENAMVLECGDKRNVYKKTTTTSTRSASTHKGYTSTCVGRASISKRHDMDDKTLPDEMRECAETGRPNSRTWSYMLKKWADRIEREYVRMPDEDHFKVVILGTEPDGAVERLVRNEWDGSRDEHDEFSEAIERYYLRRPSFDDGEPVQFGDRFAGSGASRSGEVDSIKFWDDGNVRVRIGGHHGEYADVGCDDEQFRREPAQVLAADGKPLVVGETVYDVYGESITITEVGNDGRVSFVDESGVTVYVPTCNLTHTRPDTQERIDEDMMFEPNSYCRNLDIDTSGMYYSDVVTAMLSDLLRRQRELDGVES